MKIKQTYLNEGDKVINIYHNSIDILSDDNRTLFTIHLNQDGSITIGASSTVKHADTVLENLISVEPRASDVITVRRLKYKK